jgi:pimeloyl-ACP methyl ester carboxylesterase
VHQSLNYNIIGKGPPILLIHGIPSTASLWGPLISLLSDKFTFVSINLPGFGGSPKLNINPQNSLQDIANLSVKIMIENGFEKFHLIGHSFGGAVATTLSHVYPENIVSLILSCPFTPNTQVPFNFGMSNTFFKISNSIWNKLNNYSRNKLTELGVKRAYGLGYLKERADVISQEICDEFLLENIYSLLSNFNKNLLEQAYNSLSEKNFKITIIGADNDKVIPYKNFIEIQKKLLNSNAITIKNCGHTPMWQYSELFAQIINSHINDI